MIKKSFNYLAKHINDILLLFLMLTGVVLLAANSKLFLLLGVDKFRAKYYEEICQTKEFKRNISWSNRVAQFELFHKPTDVVMIGDSITHQGHWVDMFPDVKIANRGVGGDKTDDVLIRLNAIIKIKPHKAFLMMGINDFGWGRCLEDVFLNYIDVIKILQAEKIEVFIQSTIECSKSVCGSKLERVRLLNKKLQKYSFENNVNYININEVLSNHESGLLDQYTTDGIHLNSAAYVVWRQKIEKHVIEFEKISK